MDRSGAAGWHLWVDESGRPGYVNMSVDLALLDRAEHRGESWLRLYQWVPHCLSFGRHEPALRRYDRRRIDQMGLDTVRRPSGGRAVWHGPELTYAIAAPLTRFDSAPRAYQEIHQMLSDSFACLGMDARLAVPRRAPSLDAGSCFASAVGGEVLINGRKTVGSAQLCRGSALLQHGSILLRNEQDLVRSLARSGAQEANAPALTPDLSGEGSIGLTELSHAIASAAAARWSGRWQRAPETDSVLIEAAVYFPQFQSPEWTWLR